MIHSLLRTYFIPVETNSIWYALGGVLGIALQYRPDAGIAWQTTRNILHEPVWWVILNFHYYNAYLLAS